MNVFLFAENMAYVNKMALLVLVLALASGKLVSALRHVFFKAPYSNSTQRKTLLKQARHYVFPVLQCLRQTLLFKTKLSFVVPKTSHS